MKKSTMKWRILKYNILFLIGFVTLTFGIFHFSIRFYIEEDIAEQLNDIASRAEETALSQGAGFLKKRQPPPMGYNRTPLSPYDTSPNKSGNDGIYQFYLMLDRSLRDNLSVLNADFILYDDDKLIINSEEEGYLKVPEDVMDKFKSNLSITKGTEQIDFRISGEPYTAVIKSVSGKNSFGLGWIVIYSSLKKLNQLQQVILTILIIILVISSLVIAFLSSLAAKKISAPFSLLSMHMSRISERNFMDKLDFPADAELAEVVKNINIMTEKLDSYDKAQQTFLQNASHEFRTPLMSIQSYAEGIKYNVIDTETAVDIIIQETKRMTNLVEDLLYLSRLDAIEENYRFASCDISRIIESSISRLNALAIQDNITLSFSCSANKLSVMADEEKLSRAITNIIANDIRYAGSNVRINLVQSSSDSNLLELYIYDDGPGFEASELPYIFDRFYKGKKGKFGLGLAIAKNVIEKHNGNISAENTSQGSLFLIRLPVLQ